MEYVVVSYKEVMEKDKETLKNLIDNFSVSMNVDVEIFLKNKAEMFEKTGVGRTYLILHTDPENVDKKYRLIAYFTISNQYIIDLKGITQRTLRKITSSTQLKNNECSILLIGQLARNDSYNSSNFEGSKILLEAMKKIIDVHNIIGGRIVAVECKKELVNFYKKNGFEFFKDKLIENKESNYKIMISKISSSVEKWTKS